MTRPALLFFSPVLPSPVGNGLAMRQAQFLGAFAEFCRVHLHVVRLFPPSPDPESLRRLSGMCASVFIQEVEHMQDTRFQMIARLGEERYRLAALGGYEKPALLRYATRNNVAEAAHAQAGKCIDALHIGRLYLAPFARPFRDAPGNTPAWTSLDLDDHESAAHRRLAKLHRVSGHPAAAWLAEKEASKYAALERSELASFDWVSLASDLDREVLSRHLPEARTVYVPNAIKVPPRPRRKHGGSLRLLFVGSMGYLPNEDAALFFMGEVLPRLRTRSARPVMLTIAGSSPSPRLCALARSEGVRITGHVAELGPFYEDADISVAPLRAGGGTRIKILEAFAHRCPVVATRLGAEGISANDGQHLLLADDAEGLATACLRLAEDRVLGRRLAANALRLLRRDHSHVAANARIRALTPAIGTGPVRRGPLADAPPRHPT